MKSRTFIVLVSGLITAAACQNIDPEKALSPEMEPAQEPAGTLYVKFGEDVSPATKASTTNAILENSDVLSIERLFPDAGEWEPRHVEAGLDRWYVVKYGSGLSKTKAEKSFSALEGIATVETPIARKPTASRIPFNDTYRNNLWGLCNYGQQMGFKEGMDINVLPVWENYTAGKNNVVVAVIDGGILPGHPDLDGVVDYANSYNFVSKKATITGHDHGTHVAGTIAAINNNGKGVCGVAGGSDGKGGVKLISCQIFEGETGGSSEQASVWAADHGAVISNNSWGYDYKTEAEAKNGKMGQAEKDAIDYFIKNAGCDKDGNQVGPMKGGVVIFAAGNDNWTYAQPSPYEAVIAVGAYNANGARSSYSNFGDWVDIAAPGGDYDEASMPVEWMILSTSVDDHGKAAYMWMGGTSMACPHVSGIAALLVSQFGGPGFTNDDLKEMLLEGADPDFKTDKPIGRRADAYGSFLVNSGHADDPLPTITTDHTGDIKLKSYENTQILFRISNNQDSKYSVYVRDESGAVSGELTPEGNYLVTIDALKASLVGKTYKASIYAGFSASRRTEYELTYTIASNTAPRVGDAIGGLSFEQTGVVTVDLSKSLYDPDNDPLTYTFDDEADLADYSVEGRTLKINLKKYGSTTVKATVKDPRGLSATQSFVIINTDPATPPACYPLPVKDNLYVSKGAERELEIIITNTSGTVLHSAKKVCSAYSPAVIDMSACAPGVYGLTVKYDGQESRKTIVKK